MIYNLTNITSAHDPLAVVVATNELTGGVWATMVLLIAFLVIFVATKKSSSTVSFGAASIITATLAIMFRIADLIPDYVLVMSSVLAAVGFVLVWFSD